LIGGITMTLILPGVEIKVVKEIVVGQLAPSGILGLIGITEDDENGNTLEVSRASSYKAFKDNFGPAADFTVPEVKQAFQNGIGEIVMVPLGGSAAGASSLDLKKKTGDTKFKLAARAKGLWGNDIKVKFEGKADDDDNITLGKMVISYGDAVEFFDNLSMNPDASRYLPTVVNAQSDMVKVSVPGAKKDAGAKKDDKKAPAKVDLELPADFEGNLAGGRTVIKKDFDEALELLTAEEDVDLVTAHIEDYSDRDVVKYVHATLEAHSNVMSDNCFNRIGFGQAPPPSQFKNTNEEIKYISKMTNTMSSDRFIICAPHGCLGAVVGLVGNLPVHYSPTFKTLSGVTGLSRKYGPSHLKTLLKSNILALEEKKGKGIIVEKGICTSGEQISVQRVADKAVRGAKLIGDQFIGTLNNMAGRAALKEKCTEFYLQMEKDGEIVPNADETDPAFKVDVYATDDDITKGIVRLDVAVRPVRAIDYIYGTILVRV
jgi:hypothetical protein